MAGEKEKVSDVGVSPLPSAMASLYFSHQLAIISGALRNALKTTGGTRKRSSDW